MTRLSNSLAIRAALPVAARFSCTTVNRTPPSVASARSVGCLSYLAFRLRMTAATCSRSVQPSLVHAR